MAFPFLFQFFFKCLLNKYINISNICCCYYIFKCVMSLIIIIIIILPCFILWGMCCVIVGNMHTSVFAIKIWVLNLFCKWMHYLNCQNIYISNLPHKLCILVLLWNLLNSVGKYSMAFTGSIKPVPLCQKWLPIFPFAVTAGKLKQQKWREKKKANYSHAISLSDTHLL